MNDKVVKALKMSGLKIKKYSPEILMVTGVIGTITSTILACKATTKAGSILAELDNDVKAVKKVKESVTEDLYSEKDQRKDLTIVYGQTGIKFARLYGPAVALGIFSLGCMIGSHTILNKRNAALAVAYASVDKGFKEYRRRVSEKYGKDADIEILTNVKAKKIEEKQLDKKTGKEKKVKKTVDVADPYAASPYARFFDEGCAG